MTQNKKATNKTALDLIQSRSLLLLHDGAQERDSLKLTLQNHGFQIQEWHFEQLREPAEVLMASHLVVFDCCHLNAKTTQKLHELCQIVSRPPIIVSCSHFQESDQLALEKQGVFAILKKPFLAIDLVSAVDNALTTPFAHRRYQAIHQKVLQSEKLHRFLVNNSPDIIYTLNEKGEFTYINDRVQTLLNYRKEELIGQHFSTILNTSEHLVRHHLFNERRTTNRISQSSEMRLNKKLFLNDKSDERISAPFEIHAMGIYETSEVTQNRHFRGTYGIARDISARKQAETMMRFQAYHDLLTGLPNRTLFRDRLALAITHAKRNNSKVAVMFLDLDRFKSINDTLGHGFGDQLIQTVSQRISACLREGDTLSRFGGDEFTLLLPNIHSQNDASIIARKINRELKLPFYIEQHEVFISGSIGIALFPDHGTQIEMLIQNADIAMYHTKTCGKDGFQYYSERLNLAYTKKLDTEKALRHCLEAKQLFLEYQPVFHAEDNQAHSMEAFLRWNHPDKGALCAADFLKIAEDTGLILEIGAWVIHQVCSDLQEWGNPFLRIAINISPQQIEHADFENLLMKAVQTHNVSPNQLELEITEQLLVRDQTLISSRLKRLHRLGFTITVDNFGTGFSSLNVLHKLPIDTIKIDQSFLQNIHSESNTSDVCIVNAIIAMAERLNLNIVAEGVETPQQRQYLQRLGCQNMQGWLFQKPVPAKEAKHIPIAHATIKS